MESRSETNKETVGSLPNLSISSGNKIISTSDGNSSEERNTTKSLLEDVCTDFESMDVIPPKNNKIMVIRKTKAEMPKTTSSPSAVPAQPAPSQSTTASTVLEETQSSAKIDISNTNSENVITQTQVNTLLQQELIQPVTSTEQQNDCLEQSNYTTLINVNPALQVNTQVLPLNNCENSGNITVVSEGFHDKNISSLAELADAEIVPTSDNSVSLIISNPRLIKVLTNSNEPTAALSAVIAPPSSIIESNAISDEQMGIIDPAVISNIEFQDITIPSGISVLDESLFSDKDSYSPLYIDKNSDIMNIAAYDSTNKLLHTKGKYIRRTSKSNVSDCGVKARRISAKMKAAWASELEANGHLICKMPGCSQTFVTVANYQTHFKYCTGKKHLSHCLYCDSLIFSSYRAVLQHMEVEHPDKVEEYKAKYPPDEDFDEGNLQSQLIVAEDENVAMNIEEVITQSTPKPGKKRKLSAKENVLFPHKAAIKNKMKSIKESVSENIKEFRKCVRFDNIVDKINSVSDFTTAVEETMPVEKTNKKRKKLIFSESIVAERKYFEDEEEVDGNTSQNISEIVPEISGRTNTKARMMLNLERYKRYKEYLKVTRDWSSERRTYSRSRGSESSVDNSYLLALQNEYIKDMHQLQKEEGANISLDTSEIDLNSNNTTSLQTCEVTESENFNTVTPTQSVSLEDPSLKDTEDFRNLVLNPDEKKYFDSNLFQNSSEKNYLQCVVKKEKTTCYSRPNQPTSTPVRSEIPRFRPLKYAPIITYGMTVPVQRSKPVEPPITFDSLVNSFKEPKQVRKNIQENSDNILNSPINSENLNKPSKEDGIKDPNSMKTSDISPKSKRGRPPKIKVEPVDNVTSNKKVKTKTKYKAKKYNSAVIKNIEKNARNRNTRLLAARKNSKFKHDARKYARMAHIRASKSKLKDIKMKEVKESLSRNRRETSGNNNACINSIICEENIDSHLPVDGVPTNTSDINKMTTDHNYSNFVTDINAIISSVANENVVGEVEIVSSNAENICDSDKANIINLQENETSQQPVSSADIHPVSNADIRQSEERDASPSRRESKVIESEATEEESGTNVHEVAQTSNLENIAEKCSKDNAAENEVSSSKSQKVDKDTNINENRKVDIENDINVPAQYLPGNIINKESSELLVDQALVENSDVVSMPIKESLTSSQADSVQKANEAIEKAIEVREISAEIDEISAEVQAISAKVQEMSAKIPACVAQNKVQLDVKESEQNEASNVSEILPSRDSNIINSEKDLQSAENSEANSIVEQSSVSEQLESVAPEVKRGRGRPRKNKGKIVKPSSPNKTHVIQSTISTENMVKTNQSTPIASTENIPLSNDKNTQIHNEDSEMQDSITDENRSVPVRKSERVKKRKLAELFEPPKVETKKPAEIVHSTPVIRTGRRGRPRKYPLKDSDLNLSHIKNDEQVQKTPEVESEPLDENLRKYSRKGRPRKCVRYADINSGVDSSESLDGLNSMKEKSQSASESSIPGDISVNEIGLVEDLKHSEENSKGNSATENIILPLKKRKQNRTDDSVDENIYDTSIDSKEKSENVNSSAKKTKIDNENEDKVSASKKKKKLQSTASKKQKKKQNQELEKEREELDKESHIANNTTGNKRVLRASRQKNFIAKMGLEELSDSSDIEDGRKKSKRESKKEKDADFIPGKSTSASKFASRVDSFKTSVILRQPPVAAENLFPNFKPKQFMWKLLHGKDYYSYLPPIKTSPYFKLEKAWTKSESTWNCLSYFDSAPIDKESCHFTFFTGGPALCSAWCPTPSDENITQYIAVAINGSLNKYHTYVSTDSEKGIVQLWNVGFLKDKVLNSKPVMELGISHNHGLISDMAWCPSGCWENPSIKYPDNNLPRLGLLALACSDSYIRIYSIPHPTFLPKDSERYPLYSSCPSIILRPMYGGECTVTRKSICISVAWQKTEYCERIAGGYGNGMIFIWLISSTATILANKTKEEQIVISPYLIFNAHGTPVTSVSFSDLPGSRFLVSSSTDKTLKFWDLIDISLPFFTVRKGASRSAEWANNYCGAFASLDHGMNAFKGSSFFIECGTENFPTRVLSNPYSCIIKSSFSDLLRAQAVADASGVLAVSFVHHHLLESMKFPHYHSHTVYQTRMQKVDGILEKICFSSYPESVNCINVIQELKETISVAYKLTEDCDRHLNPSQYEKCEEISTASLCSASLISGKRKRSYELKNDEWMQNVTELSNKCSEIADVVSVMTDMEDVISSVTHLTENCIYVYENEQCKTVNEDTSAGNQTTSEVLCDIIEKVSNEVDIEQLTSTLLENVENMSPSSDVPRETVEETSAEIPNEVLLDNTKLTEETTEKNLSVASNVICDLIEKVITEISEENSACIVDDITKENIDENETLVSRIVSNLVESVSNEVSDTKLKQISDLVEEEIKGDSSEISNILHSMIEKVVLSLDTSKCIKETNATDESVVVSDTLCDLVNQISNEMQTFPAADMKFPRADNIAYQSDSVISDVISNLIEVVSTNLAKDSYGPSNSEIGEKVEDCIDNHQSMGVLQCSEEISEFEVECDSDSILLKEKECAITNMKSSDECPVATNLIEEAAGLVSLVADMKCIISTIDQITNNDIFPSCIVPSTFKLHELLSDSQVTNQTENSKYEVQSSQEVTGILCCLIKKISEEMLECSEVKTNHTSLKEPKEKNEQSVIQNQERTENDKLLSECLEIRDLVSLVADMKDIVCAMSHLIKNSESPGLVDQHLIQKPESCHPESSSHSSTSAMINDANEEFESVSTISDILQSLVKRVTEKLSSNKKLAYFSNDSVTNEEMADNNGFSDVCFEIINIVDTVNNVKDVISSVVELVDKSESTLSISNQTSVSSLGLTDILSEESSLLQTKEQQIENSGFVAGNRKEIIEENIEVINHVKNDEASELLVVSDILNNLTETVAERMHSQIDNSNIASSDVEMMDISDENVAPNSAIPSTSASKLELDTSLKNKLYICSGTSDELPVNSSSLDISPYSGSVCNNDVPQTQASCDDNMDYEAVEPHRECEDQVMSPVDSESSNSENEMDSDEEAEMDSSFVFDRETNFSDDSMLSECSLATNSSIGSSSDDSVMSEDFASPTPGDQDSVSEIPGPVSHTANEESDNKTSQPSSLFSFISEISSNLPERKKAQCDSSETISETLENSGSDLMSSHNLDIKYSAKKINDNGLNNETEKQSSLILDQAVPETSTTDVDLENNHKLDNASVENQNAVDNLQTVRDTLEAQESTTCNLGMEESPSTCNNTSHISSGDCIYTTVSLDSTENNVEVSTLVCTDETSDKHSSNNTESVDSTSFSNEICIKNAEHNTEVDMYIGKKSEESSSQNFSEPVHKSIFDGDAPSETVCINNEPAADVEETNTADTEPVSEKLHAIPNKKYIFYENVATEYGLVFRDENTMNFENVKDSKTEESCDFSLDKYHLAAVKTVAWNPNVGSHFWLFSAGQSGLARVSYIPDVNRNKIFKRKDT